MYCYSGLFAGVRLTFHFQYPGTAGYYRAFLEESDASDESILIPERDVRDWMALWKVNDPAYAEFANSCSYACDRLMTADRVVFHGAALFREGKVWLFTGPSGIGKTTQARLWQSLFGDSVLLLNGDKPILEICADNEVLVHPSPWKGKEGYGRDDVTAPLGGIIILQQAPENQISRIDPGEAAKKLFCRIYSTFNTKKEVLATARILEAILSRTPVWLLQNRGDEDSARMTWEALRKEGGQPCATD